MKLNIISVGDELLIGQTLNTNAHWIASQMTALGFEVDLHVSIGDQEQKIFNTVDEALNHSDVVLITGGLGPTNDDLTMPVLCKYFDGELIRDNLVYKDIEQFVSARGAKMNENNEKQAVVPNNCQVIRNKNGTAPGLLFERENKTLVSMPGVPHEMKSMMINSVIPFLKEKYKLPVIVNNTVHTYDIPESELAELLYDWENNLSKDLKLSYLPSPGRVKLRLSSNGKDREKVSESIRVELNKLIEIIPNNIYSLHDVQIEEVVGKFLTDKKASISTAESCTGGYVSHLITKVPGSSSYYKGSVIAYSNEVKRDILGVKSSSLDSYGAVSREVVEQMAVGVKTKLETDYSIATSGIAGPDGGTKEKPVGTVWIAVATPDGVVSDKYSFGAKRSINIEKTAVKALSILAKIFSN